MARLKFNGVENNALHFRHCWRFSAPLRSAPVYDRTGSFVKREQWRFLTSQDCSKVSRGPACPGASQPR